MDAWMYIILFFIVLFSYIHIQKQWKIEHDTEIYEYEYTSLKQLQSTCEYKQPIIFELNVPKPNFDIGTMQVKDTRDKRGDLSIGSISLSFENTKNLIQSDTNSAFYSDKNNISIIQHSDCKKWFHKLESLLKPQFTMNVEYDILYGSRKTQTIPQFHHESHTFLYLPRETNRTYIRLKMISTKYNKYLKPYHDYVNYEFTSNMNLFNMENFPYSSIDVLVKPGHVVFIPAYWYYSIEFQDKDTEICMVKFTTIANACAHLKHYCLYYLQQYNVQEKWWKPLQNIDVNLMLEETDDETDYNQDNNHDNDNDKNVDSTEKVKSEQTIVENLVEQLSIKDDN